MKKEARIVAIATCMISALTGWPLVTDAATSRAQALSSVVPRGTEIGMTKTFVVDNTEMAVIATKGSTSEQRPWIIIARKDSRGWTPVTYFLTADAWQPSDIVVGANRGHSRAVAVSFIVDGATGIMSNIYTVDIGPRAATLVASLPHVFEAAAVHPSQDGFSIYALNLDVEELASGTKWVIKSTPAKQLLSQAAPIHVSFLMGAAAPGTKDKGKIYMIGPARMRAKVGDTLSFVPWNGLAEANLLGAYDNLGNVNGISEYVAVPGGGTIQFYQAAQVLANYYRLTVPGKYTFAVVPPAYQGMKPDPNCAVVTVMVTR